MIIELCFALWATLHPVERVEMPMPDEHALYAECGLNGVLNEAAFRKARASMKAHGAQATVIAIADMTRPSTEQRLYVVDLAKKKLLVRTWVAHGRNSGELYCRHTSNAQGSLKTSRGLYRVGERIISPKHGDALLLHGLDRGVNDKAEEREIIMHGAEYVNEEYIRANGRAGRSFGCPAVPQDRIGELIALLADGGLLYVHAR